MDIVDSSYINNPDTETDNMVNLYAFYILEIALRIAVLEVIGVNVSDDVKNYVMDEHLDWIKLEKYLTLSILLPILLLTGSNNMLNSALICHNL